MSRRMLRSARPYAVWLGVTAAVAAAAWSVPGAWREAAGATAPEPIADLLVAGCATVLALSLGLLWLVTSVTVARVVTGAVPQCGGATRRLVLLACGSAVVAGAALPARASGGDGAEVLVGLALPERAVAPATVARPAAPATTPTPRTAGPRSTAGEAYVVRTGDSLWSIARAHPAPGVGVEGRWRAIWRHNRHVVGGDPDLIHPGQALRLPGARAYTHRPTDTEKDGERR